ncbi:MAG: hypothetical protein R3B39_01600 [Candidatus Paceibacterota bacterium]
MMRERITSTSNATRERQKKAFVKLLWYFLFLIFFVIGLSFLSRIDSLLIKEVNVSGNTILKEEDISKKTLSLLSKKRLLLFFGQNKFILSKKNIENSLKKEFPRILTIESSLEGNSINFSLTERERAHLWCGDNPPAYGDRLSSDEDCYFLDNSGFIFDTSPKFSSGVYFTFYKKIEDENPIGQYILDFDFLKDLESFIKGVKDAGFPVHSLVALDGGQYELLFNISSIHGDYAKLLFTEDQNLEEIYNKLISIVDEDPFKTDFENSPNGLEYIDARFANRIFYKFAE